MVNEVRRIALKRWPAASTTALRIGIPCLRSSSTLETNTSESLTTTPERARRPKIERIERGMPIT